MTPPPTSAEEPLLRAGRLASWWTKAQGYARDAAFYLPRLGNRQAWFRLVRLPNLLTVPGDVLAGFLLAPTPAAGTAWARLLLVIPAAWFFYAAGLIFNDFFDFAEDLRERPDRPLPAKRISRESAVVVALVLMWVGTFFAAFVDALPVALPLVLFILLYDAGLKKVRILGPVLMGLCRACNLLLGAVAASAARMLPPGPILGAIVLGLYIGAVTHLARKETSPGARFKPGDIGRLLGLLIPLQAVLCLMALHRFPANLLGLALWPLRRLHRRWSSRFPPS